MKTINILIITLVLGLLSSCKTGFYSQKYTNLKPLKSPIEKIDAPATSQAKISSECKVQMADLENEVALLSEEDQKQIQDAITNGLPIYVVAEKAIYKVVNPSYDQFYNALSGGFHTIIDKAYLEEDHLELFQDDFSPSRIDPFIYMNNISSVLNYKVVIDPEVKENSLDLSGDVAVETTNTNSEPIKKMTWKEEKKIKIYELPSDDKHEVHQSENLRRGKKNFLVGGAILLLSVGIGAAIFFIFWSVFGLLLIGLAYVIFFFFLVDAAVKIGLYVQECKIAGVKPSKKAQAIRGVLWFFLIVLYFVWYMLPPLVALAFVKSAQKKRY